MTKLGLNRWSLNGVGWPLQAAEPPFTTHRPRTSGSNLADAYLRAAAVIRGATMLTFVPYLTATGSRRAHSACRPLRSLRPVRVRHHLHRPSMLACERAAAIFFPFSSGASRYADKFQLAFRRLSRDHVNTGTLRAMSARPHNGQDRISHAMNVGLCWLSTGR
jgi:hypothetical protein